MIDNQIVTYFDHFTYFVALPSFFFFQSGKLWGKGQGTSQLSWWATVYKMVQAVNYSCLTKSGLFQQMANCFMKSHPQFSGRHKHSRKRHIAPHFCKCCVVGITYRGDNTLIWLEKEFVSFSPKTSPPAMLYIYKNCLGCPSHGILPVMIERIHPCLNRDNGQLFWEISVGFLLCYCIMVYLC